MRLLCFPVASLAAVLVTGAALPARADLSFGVASANEKIRPTDSPALVTSAHLKAARNELEAFQLVFHASADESAISVALDGALTGPGGAAIPADHVTLYRVGTYDVGAASNSEGAAGLWPDPLIPDVDTYVGEKRNAFPMSVKAGESGSVWVEILVPMDAVPGDYSGSVSISRSGATAGTIPISLHVGTFALPSTASLKSLFGMGWADPCIAHYGSNSCGPGWNEMVGDQLRALYVRAALEHRFTVAPIDYQPPFGASAPLFDATLGKYVDGTGASRLPGARVTTMQLDGQDADLSKWIDYAKSKSFFDRLVFYPVDEPGADSGKWSQFIAESKALHEADAAARILITSSIQDADAAGSTSSIDIFVPVIDQMENRPGSTYAGNQRAKYDSWLSGHAGREVWGYQSCDSHGCGACGDPSPDPAFTGWPSRVIDSSAVQDRAFEWLAFRYGLTGELYFQTTFQLATAWQSNGQCAFSGSGDGTVFYPGTPDRIGGTTGIPIESIRMKMIREGMEDYEYLTLASKKDSAKAHLIADTLFPTSYSCAQPAAALEAARDQLFAMLDEASGGAGGGGGSGSAGAAGSPGGGGQSSTGGQSVGGAAGAGGPSGGHTGGGAAGKAGSAGSSSAGGAAGHGGSAPSTGGASNAGTSSSHAGSPATGDAPTGDSSSGDSGGCAVRPITTRGSLAGAGWIGLLVLRRARRKR